MENMIMVVGVFKDYKLNDKLNDVFLLKMQNILYMFE